MSRPLYVNGKFTVQRVTGVQRAATGLLTALDDALGRLGRLGAESPRCVLLCPPGGSVPVLRHAEVRVIGAACALRFGLHAWEQAVLPWHARDGVLLNLAGAAPRWGGRQVCVLHDAAVFDHPEAYTWLFVAWYRSLFARLSRKALLVLTVSAFSKERLLAALAPHGLRSVAVLPLGADHLDALRPDATVISRLGLQRDGFVLAVGSANPTKNFALLAAALQQMAGRGALRLVMVGGVNAAVFAASHATLPRDGSLIHAGPVDDAQLKALYGHALALVFPSRYEGFGLPALEAMASGCPVAAARAGAIPEVCADAALYFDPHDVHDIAAALTRLAHDAGLRAQLRAAGLAHAARYRWRDAGEALLAQLLPSLCDRRA